MKNQYRDHDASLQWEGLQSPCRITNLRHPSLLTGSSAATTSRDDSYYLRCEVEGFSSSPFAPAAEFQRKWRAPLTFSGVSDGYTVSLSNCHLTQLEVKPDSDSGLFRNNSFRLVGSADRVEQKAAGKWKQTTHIDWFLNGPHDSVFPRKTLHQHDLGYVRKIDGYPEFTLASGTSSPGFSVDCAMVHLPAFSFVLRALPKEFGPPWSRNVAIEYSTKLSRIPDPNTREAVAEVVSFVLGRRLIDVGDTALTTHHDFAFHMQKWDVSEVESVPPKIRPDFAFHLRSWNPRGINVRGLCSMIDFPPIPIERLHRGNNQSIESVLTRLVPVYLQRRRRFDLDQALWRYWIFQELPLGIELPMLVSAIEILAAAWFSSPSSASHGNFAPKQEFVRLLKPELKGIHAKLDRAAKGEPSMSRLRDPAVLGALMQRVQNSFEMGQSARTQHFFRELGVKATAAQLESLKARHGQIHSHGAGNRPAKLWSFSENLRTVFYKTILRLLDYSGEYLDWAERKPAAKLLRPFRSGQS